MQDNIKISSLKKIKNETIEQIKEKVNHAQSVVAINYKGLNVIAFEKLRKILKQNNCELKVYKNTLFSKAINAQDVDNDYFIQSNAFVFSYDNAYLPYKLVEQFKKQNKSVEIKFSYLDKKLVNKEVSQQYATLPSREESISALLGSILMPVRKFANLLTQIQK